MSIKKNALANYTDKIYASLIGLLVFPLYLSTLGAESYGLVALFLLLQAWLSLLDLGLSPTLARESARLRSGAISLSYYRQVLRSFECIFCLLSVAIALGLGFASPWITHRWLRIETLPAELVIPCVRLMGIVVALRLLSGLYRGGVQGFEKQVWFSLFSITVATLRFPIGLLVIVFSGGDLLIYFQYQVAVATLEAATLFGKLYRTAGIRRLRGGFALATVKSALPFAAGLGYTGAIWVLLTQFDKLMLSHVLTLAEYGYLSLVVVVAGAVTILSVPIGQAVLPRLTFLHSGGEEARMIDLYRRSSRLVCALVFPVVGILAVFPRELLHVWTGDPAAVHWGGEILCWYALGNGIVAVSAFQYYLQFAHGKIRLHVIYNSILAAVTIPIIGWVALSFGALAVARTFFFFRLVSFLIWTPFIHHRFAPGLHSRWILRDVLPPLALSSAAVIFLRQVAPEITDLERGAGIGVLGAATLSALIVSLLANPSIQATAARCFTLRLAK